MSVRTYFVMVMSASLSCLEECKGKKQDFFFSKMRMEILLSPNLPTCQELRVLRVY